MRTTFGNFDEGLFVKVHHYTMVYLIVDCSQNFLYFWRIFFEVPVVCHNLIFDCGPLIRVFLLFQRNFSVVPVFMAYTIFQSLLVDHIWMLLLLQKIFSEVLILMLLYSVVDHLHGNFHQNSDHKLTFKLSFIVVGQSTIRNFSEGPALAIGPFHKVQREVIYFPYVVRKNEKPR